MWKKSGFQQQKTKEHQERKKKRRKWEIKKMKKKGNAGTKKVRERRKKKKGVRSKQGKERKWRIDCGGAWRQAMIKDWKCPYKRNRKKRKKIGEVHIVGKLGQVCNGSGGGPGWSNWNTENTVKMRQRQNKYAHNPLVHGMKEGENSDDGIVAKKLLGQPRRHGRTTKNGSHGEQRREKSVGRNRGGNRGRGGGGAGWSGSRAQRNTKN